VGGRSAVKTVSGSLQNTSAKFLPTRNGVRRRRRRRKKKKKKKERRRRRKKNKLSLMDGDLLKHAAVATDQFFFVAKALIIYPATDVAAVALDYYCQRNSTIIL
jgi:hypothetical protein